MAIKIVDLNLDQIIQPITGLEGYQEVWLLVKLHGLPLGDVKLPVLSSKLEREYLIEQVVAYLGWNILMHLLEDAFISGENLSKLSFISKEINNSRQLENFEDNQVKNLLNELLEEETKSKTEPACISWRRSKATWMVTVAISTRNGAGRLTPCLDALDALDYPNFEILIIDNASDDDATWKLLEKRGASKYRYIIEPRPGLSWARNRAITEAKGDIIAMTDDDARPDPLWLLSLVAALQRPGISLVAGRAYAVEIENDVQEYFELYGGRDRGFERKEINPNVPGSPKHDFNAQNYGGGYNLAGWKEVFQKVGGYDPALGRGSLAGSGTEADLIYRLLRQGHIIAYEPTSFVRLIYPSDLKYAVRHHYLGASGNFAFLTKHFLNDPSSRGAAIKHGWNILLWNFQKIAKNVSFSERAKRTRSIQIAWLKGVFKGPGNYLKSLKVAQEVANRYRTDKAEVI
jgi:glycosyltransferase involved in cell wall biosynthesis